MHILRLQFYPLLSDVIYILLDESLSVMPECISDRFRFLRNWHCSPLVNEKPVQHAFQYALLLAFLPPNCSPWLPY